MGSFHWSSSLDPGVPRVRAFAGETETSPRSIFSLHARDLRFRSGFGLRAPDWGLWTED